MMQNDPPMFNDNSDLDYSNASEALEAEGSLQVQVRLHLEELLLFKGTQVEIVRFGDDVSNPLVSGLLCKFSKKKTEKSQGRQRLPCLPYHHPGF